MIDAEKQTGGNRQERDAAGRFAAGNVGGPGRPKGEPNRVGGDLKADLWQAYVELGGREWLRRLSPRVFAGLLAKLLPRELAADLRVEAGGSVDFDAMSDEELAREAHSAGFRAYRIDGKACFVPDTRDALNLAAAGVEAALDGRELPQAKAEEALADTAAALRNGLPNLQALLAAVEQRLTEQAVGQ